MAKFNEELFNKAIKEKNTSKVIEEARKMTDRQLKKYLENYYALGCLHIPSSSVIFNLLSKVKNERK